MTDSGIPPPGHQACDLGAPFATERAALLRLYAVHTPTVHPPPRGDARGQP
jgi:hypothetical protein